MNNIYFKTNLREGHNSLTSIYGYYLKHGDFAVVVSKNNSLFYKLVDYVGRFVPDDDFPNRLSPEYYGEYKKWERIASEPQSLGGKGERKDPPNTSAGSFSIWLATNIR